MNLSKITTAGLAALMAAAALGAVPVCAQTITSTDDTTVSAEKMAVHITADENGFLKTQGGDDGAISFSILEEDTENSYNYTVKYAEELSENAEVIYTVTTAEGTVSDLTYTSANDTNTEKTDLLNYQISFDEQTSKILISKDGGKTWKALPMQFYFNVAE